MVPASGLVQREQKHDRLYFSSGNWRCVQRPAPQDGYTLGVLVIDMKRFYPVTKFSIWPCEAIAHMSNRLSQILFMSLCMMMVPLFASAQSDIEQSPAADTRQEGTIRTLNSLITLQTELKSDIKRLGRELEKAQSPSEKKEIQAQLDELEADLVSTTQSLKEIAAGADIASLRACLLYTSDAADECPAV